MDQAQEEKTRKCQLHQKNSVLAPLHPWTWPYRPLSRLHPGYAGPFGGKMCLVSGDAHFKCVDIHPVNSATSSTTIGHLHTLFATDGLPEKMVTDNRSCFTSEN